MSTHFLQDFHIFYTYLMNICFIFIPNESVGFESLIKYDFYNTFTLLYINNPFVRLIQIT